MNNIALITKKVKERGQSYDKRAKPIKDEAMGSSKLKPTFNQQ